MDVINEWIDFDKEIFTIDVPDDALEILSQKLLTNSTGDVKCIKKDSLQDLKFKQLVIIKDFSPFLHEEELDIKCLIILRAQEIPHVKNYRTITFQIKKEEISENRRLNLEEEKFYLLIKENEGLTVCNEVYSKTKKLNFTGIKLICEKEPQTVKQ